MNYSDILAVLNTSQPQNTMITPNEQNYDIIQNLANTTSNNRGCDQICSLQRELEVSALKTTRVQETFKQIQLQESQFSKQQIDNLLAQQQKSNNKILKLMETIGKQQLALDELEAENGWLREQVLQSDQTITSMMLKIDSLQQESLNSKHFAQTELIASRSEAQSVEYFEKANAELSKLVESLRHQVQQCRHELLAAEEQSASELQKLQQSGDQQLQEKELLIQQQLLQIQQLTADSDFAQQQNKLLQKQYDDLLSLNSSTAQIDNYSSALAQLCEPMQVVVNRISSILEIDCKKVESADVSQVLLQLQSSLLEIYGKLQVSSRK